MEIKALASHAYPKMVQQFAKENFNLKILCALLLGLEFLSLILVIGLLRKGPIVVALDATGVVARVETKITDAQIEAAAREYLSYRYAWNEATIASQLKKAELFVLPQLSAAFQKSMANVVKFVAQKKVAQRLYPRMIEIDLPNKRILIVADRITEFDHLKAATEMRLALEFTIDRRSPINPWGVYITKESEGGGQ